MIPYLIRVHGNYVLIAPYKMNIIHILLYILMNILFSIKMLMIVDITGISGNFNNEFIYAK